MAGPEPLPTAVPLLRGLFGTLQTAAQQGLGTADIWTSLRNAVGGWSFQAQGMPQPYDPGQVELAGARILNSQGIRADTVSTFRGVAGQWLSAKQNLAAAGPEAQILAGSVFVPPWAITADSSVPSRYRIMSQWQFTDAAGGTQSQWRADELTGPLTTLSDALSQAEPNANTQSGQLVLSSGEPPVMTDFSIEQI